MDDRWDVIWPSPFGGENVVKFKGGEAYDCRESMVRENLLPWFIFSYTPSSTIRWFKRIMSEAIISRRGSSNIITKAGTSVAILQSTVFSAPVSGMYDVTVIGGGSGNNGLNGDINNTTIELNKNDQVELTIGLGGNSAGGCGGTTSFGNYVAATGGVSNISTANKNSSFGMGGKENQEGNDGIILINYLEEGESGV